MKSQVIYQVDAFATELFGGNPAAICPLDAWLRDELMQSIATRKKMRIYYKQVPPIRQKRDTSDTGIKTSR